MVAILSRRSKPAAPSSARELHSLLLCKQDRARLKGYHCLGRTCSHSWRHCSTLAVLASLFAVGHVCWRHPFHGTGGRRGRDGLRSIRFGRRLLQRLQPVGRTVAGGHHLTRMHPHARTVAGALVALLACLHRYTHSYAAAPLHDCTATVAHSNALVHCCRRPQWRRTSLRDPHCLSSRQRGPSPSTGVRRPMCRRWGKVTHITHLPIRRVCPLLLTTYYLLLTTYYSLLTTHYLLLTTYYSLLTTHY